MDGESQEERDARIKSLWQQLDTKNKGSLDYAALKNGLTKMNHPLKDADSLIKDILVTADINHDGKISYDEFVKFCRHTEQQLWDLFQSIDRDKNGDLDKSELSTAFVNAGVGMSKARLDRFFSYIDKDHNGAISFEEWRDFLLFIPSHAPGLETVMSYYQSAAKVNAEGDVHMSDEALRGLGTTLQFLKTSLFGAIVQLVQPPTTYSSEEQASISPSAHQRDGSAAAVTTTATLQRARLPLDQSNTGATFVADDEFDLSFQVEDDPHIPLKPARRKEISLTDFIPDVGYFLAGGLSGITSRTVTAPLDRLKVYLIAQTGVATKAVTAAKQGDPAAATKHGARTLANACKELWAAGGVRSLFAGNGINVVKVMPESATKFGSYEAAKRAVASLEGHDNPREISPSSQFIAGGCAGMMAQAVVYPLDTLKFRMQCEVVPGGERGNVLLWHTAVKMWKQNGLRAYYRGLPMGLIGMFPYAAIDLFTFETLKKSVTKRNMKNKSLKHEEDALPGNFILALMGGFSGAIGASAVYPLNLLRTRLQSQGTTGHPRTYTGILDVTRQTIKGEGFRGLFKGLTPNLLKVVPAVSITYVVYENTKKALHLH